MNWNTFLHLHSCGSNHGPLYGHIWCTVAWRSEFIGRGNSPWYLSSCMVMICIIITALYTLDFLKSSGIYLHALLMAIWLYVSPAVILCISCTFWQHLLIIWTKVWLDTNFQEQAHVWRPQHHLTTGSISCQIISQNLLWTAEICSS